MTVKFDADYDQMIRNNNHAQKIEINEHLLRRDYMSDHIQSEKAGERGKNTLTQKLNYLK